MSASIRTKKNNKKILHACKRGSHGVQKKQKKNNPITTCDVTTWVVVHICIHTYIWFQQRYTQTHCLTVDMYVCMYIYIYIYEHVLIGHSCVCVCMTPWKQVADCVERDANSIASMRTHEQGVVCVGVCAYVCVCVCVFLVSCTYFYSKTRYIYTHTIRRGKKQQPQYASISAHRNNTLMWCVDTHFDCRAYFRVWCCSCRHGWSGVRVCNTSIMFTIFFGSWCKVDLARGWACCEKLPGLMNHARCNVRKFWKPRDRGCPHKHTHDINIFFTPYHFAISWWFEHKPDAILVFLGSFRIGWGPSFWTGWSDDNAISGVVGKAVPRGRVLWWHCDRWLLHFHLSGSSITTLLNIAASTFPTARGTHGKFVLVSVFSLLVDVLHTPKMASSS